MKVWMLFVSWRRHHTIALAILGLLGLFRFWPRKDSSHHHYLLQVEEAKEEEDNTQQQQRHEKLDLEDAPEFSVVRKESTPSTEKVMLQRPTSTNHSTSRSSNTLKSIKRNHQRNKSTTLMIDWLSVGSKTRPDLSQAQERLYGASSRYIRHLLTADEDDDVDPSCRQVLTVPDTLAIADFCQARKKETNLPDGAKWVISDQLRYMLLNVTRHPVGWLCAQRRFALALVKVLRQYQSSSSSATSTTGSSSSFSMPDYLMIVDDDTYYHLPKFVNFLEGKNSAEDFLIPGVSYWLSLKPRFRIYHGGYGLTISKGAIHNALQPIYCRQDVTGKNTTSHIQGEHLFCPRLRDNWMGEYHIFRNGMTLMDLVHAYVITWEPFSNYQNWTTGFCFHGDWVLTYFLSYAYRIGTMHQPYCKFFCKEWKSGACLPNSHICHHVSAEIMEERASMWPSTT